MTTKKSNKAADLYARVLKGVMIRPMSLDVGIRSFVEMDTQEQTRLMPPTYFKDGNKENKKVHWIEHRYIDGELKQIAVLDSVASCANRIEEALFLYNGEGFCPMPIVEVAFQKDHNLAHNPLSALHMPHRFFSPWLLDAEDSRAKKPVRQTDLGRAICSTNPADVFRILLQCCPPAGLLGFWGSTTGNRRQVRLARSYVCDFFTVIPDNNGQTYMAQSSIDRMNVANSVKGGREKDTTLVITYDKNGIADSDNKAKGADKEAKAGTIGKQNYGTTIPSLIGWGVTPVSVHLKAWIHYSQLFQYVTGDTQQDREKDALVRAYLACMGLYGHTIRLLDKRFYALRSGCVLFPKCKDAPFSVVVRDEQPFDFTLSLEEGYELYMIAYKALVENKIIPDSPRITFKASKAQEAIITASDKATMDNHLKGTGEEGAA